MVVERLKKFLKVNEIKFENINKLMGDASTRVYFRIFVNNNRFNNEKSLIGMVLPLNIELAEKGKAEFIKEEPFLNIYKYLKKSKVLIPKIYIYDEDIRVMLLEDLGDFTLYNYIKQNQNIDLYPLYKNVIDQLVILQNYTSNNIDNSVYAYKRGFDFETLKWELDHFIEWYIDKGVKYKLTQLEREIIDKKFNKIALKLSKLPKIVTHRDFQSKNIMIKDGKYYLIDFQDALMGSEVYDLVALLKDSYIDLSEDFVIKILKYYIEEMDKNGKKIEFENFYNIFKLQTIQRKLKDTGRFHFIDQVRKNSSFLQYIPLSIRYFSTYLKDLYPDIYKIIEPSLKQN